MVEKDKFEIMKELGTNIETGLSSVQVKERQQNGRNELDAQKPKTLIAKILNQINDPMVYILIVAAGISAVMQEYSDALIIMTVISINTIMGLMQENKAQKSLDALKKLSSPKTLVRRDGLVQEIPVEELVPGDIVIIEAGRYIPADLRLVEVANLKIDESILTGESIPVEKISDSITGDEISLGDRKNMAFMSSYATYGRGVGVVVGIGMNTEIGKIAKMINSAEELKTPLQQKLGELSKILGIGAIAICVLIFAVALFEGRDIVEMLLTSISLAVAIIPEGLPAVVTIVLAMGVQRMISQNAIVKKLPAVETLGSVNVICSDKTGTITQNKMTVTKFYFNGELHPVDDLKEEHSLLIDGFILCNDASNEGNRIGDPTEIALLDMYPQSKKELDTKYKRIDEIPFDSDRKMMTTVNSYKGKNVVFTKGALDLVLKKTTHILIGEKMYPIEEYLTEIFETASLMSNEALRVLALAYKEKDDNEYESGLTLIGLVGMIDPPREEVKEAVSKCIEAGIRTVMITGDHQDTAYAIARGVGICNKIEEVMSGHTLSTMTQEELNGVIENYRVFARVQPEHKVMIVKALQSKGYIVSMTGDGVNDAPSLKTANIGVAMGVTGSDVSKEAASMILTDDNFATIVKAVEEGRNIYNNIKKSILFQLSGNLGEVVALFVAILLNWASPLKPIHILWTNLVTDSLPGLSLGVDPSEEGIMKEKPRKQDESIFAHGGLTYMIFNGILIGSLTLIGFLYGLNTNGLIYGQTMAFLILNTAQLFHSLNSRSFTKSLFKVGVFKNKYLIGSILLGILSLIVIVQIPFFNDIFKTTPVSINDWVVVLGLSLITIFANEIIKVFKR